MFLPFIISKQIVLFYSFHGKGYTISFYIYFGNFHFHMLMQLYYLVRIFYKFIGHLTYVYKSILVYTYIYKGPESGDISNNTG